MLAAVALWQLRATLWTAHSDSAGRSLVHRFLDNHALASPIDAAPKPGAQGGPGAAATATLGSCTPGRSTSTPVQGLLEVTKLNLVAPVEQGVDNAQLDVAIGHIPASVWPGQTGNAVLEAHDVSYFVGLPTLVAGDTVKYVTPCRTFLFAVSGHSVVAAGTPVYDTTGPTITMVTCWPTNALWFTPDRLLVTATETGSHRTASGPQQYETVSAPPTASIPPQLAAQGVTLTTYSLPMGTFHLAGSPSRAWAQSTEPLLVQGSGVEAFIAGIRSLTESRTDWFATLAPAVPPPSPLVGAQNPTYLSSLNVTEAASGTSAQGLSLSVTVQVAGGAAPGRYAVNVGETVDGSHLVISSWTMTPA